MVYYCRNNVSFPERWSPMEHHVANPDLDLCIATATLGLYFRILLREVCRTVTFYFHPFRVLSIVFLVQSLTGKKVCSKRVGC